MYESRNTEPIPLPKFFRRLLTHFLASSAIIFLSLYAGMLGYEHYEKLLWRDAFLNSAMLLGGMGPVNAPVTNGGKMFAGLYALYAGLIFLLVGGVLLAPLIHRIAHKLHWEAADQN